MKTPPKAPKAPKARIPEESRRTQLQRLRARQRAIASRLVHESEDRLIKARTMLEDRPKSLDFQIVCEAIEALSGWGCRRIGERVSAEPVDETDLSPDDESVIDEDDCQP